MMPMNQAAMDGIRDHGLRWKFYLKGLIAAETKKLGEFNDAIDEDDDYEQLIVPRSDSEPVVDEIVRKVRIWAESESNLSEDAKEDIEARLGELECVADCCMEEINYAMNDLYDSFDYWRICTG